MKLAALAFGLALWSLASAETTAQPNWMARGESMFLFLLGVITAYNTWKAQHIAKAVQATASDVKAVALVADASAVMTDKIHTLVNSAMGQQKKMLAEVAAAKAAITKNSPDRAAAEMDQKAADAAMADYLDHVGKQSAVDAADTNKTKGTK